MVAILLIIGLLLWVISSRVADRLIEYQYLHHNDAWLIDGKPRGMFFNPSGSSYISFCIVGFKLGWKSEVPGWVITDNEALKLYENVKLWNKLTKYFLIAFFPLLVIGKSLGF